MKRLLPLALLLAACGQVTLDDSTVGDDPSEIHAWLSAGEYRSFHAETAVLPGFVQGGRRVYLNDAAARAVRTGAPPEPGAVAVRELYDGDLATLSGWGFAQKTETGWHYYETFELNDPLGHNTLGTDVQICAGCHGGQLMSTWPLP